MNLIISNLQIPIEQDGMDAYINAANQKLKIDDGLSVVKILSKSLDLRNQDQFYYKISLVVSIHDSFENKQDFPVYTEHRRVKRKPAAGEERPIIVGFGPAGMFAALEL